MFYFLHYKIQANGATCSADVTLLAWFLFFFFYKYGLPFFLFFFSTDVELEHVSGDLLGITSTSPCTGNIPPRGAGDTFRTIWTGLVPAAVHCVSVLNKIRIWMVTKQQQPLTVKYHNTANVFFYRMDAPSQLGVCVVLVETQCRFLASTGNAPNALQWTYREKEASHSRQNMFYYPECAEK